MLSNIRCSECGQALTEDDLTCWACGVLTQRGLKQKHAGGAQDDDELWRHSVEEAKKRRQAESEVDPDETLQKVLAQQGVAVPPSSDEPLATTHVSDRSQYSSLRAMTSTLTYAGTGATVVLAVMAVILLGYSMSLLGQDNPLLPLVGFCAAVLVGTAALLTYYLLRFIAESAEPIADTADNSRRNLVLLRMVHRQLKESQPQEPPTDGDQSERR